MTKQCLTLPLVGDTGALKCIFMFLCTLRLNLSSIFEELPFKALFYIFFVASDSIFVDFDTDIPFSAFMI